MVDAHTIVLARRLWRGCAVLGSRRVDGPIRFIPPHSVWRVYGDGRGHRLAASQFRAVHDLPRVHHSLFDAVGSRSAWPSARWEPALARPWIYGLAAV